jgi:WD40 repeat protein
VLYSAFISYSHAADDKLAPVIQRALQTFAKPWYKLRALRVFRDKTSLSANPALWPAIEQALSQSAWFLFVASPRAAQSHWVQRELEWWIQHRTSERVLILLTDGDLVWDEASNDFDWVRTSAVPDILKNQFAGEPLYVDLRWAKTVPDLSLRHSRFRAAMLDIAAPVHGRAKDELDGEDVRQHRTTKRWVWTAGTALAVLAVVSIAAAIIAVQQRNQAEAGRQTAFSRQLAAQALSLVGTGHLDSALLLTLESHDVLTSSSAKTDSTAFDARSSLLTALGHGSRPIASYLRGGGLVAFSPDGRTLASVDGGQIVIWDMATRKPVGRALEGHGDAVFSLAFSRDGKTLVSSSRSKNNLRFWNLETRSPDREPITTHGGTAVSLALSPDGRTMATGGGDKAVLFWDLQTRTPSGALSGHASNVESLAFTSDGKMLASGSWDGTVILWDVETRGRLGAALGAEQASRQSLPQIESVAFSPDGSYLAAGGGGGIVLWDVATRTPIGDRMDHPGGVTSVAVSPDGTIVASGSEETAGTVILWSAKTQKRIVPPLEGHTAFLESVAFNPDGNTLVSGGADKKIILWDLTSLNRLGAVLPGYETVTDTIAVSRDGALIAAGLCNDAGEASKHWTTCATSGVRVWNRASDKPLRTFPTGSPGTPRSLVFSGDGGVMVSASCAQLDGSHCKGIRVQRWNIASGQVDTYPIDDVGPRSSSMAVGPDGNIIAVGGCKSVGAASSDCDAGEIRLFDVKTGSQIGAALIGHNRGVDELDFSPDGRTLVSSTPDDVIFWDVQTGRPKGRPYPGSATAFTSDGKVSAVAASPGSEPPRTITLRETSTGQRIGELTIGDNDVVVQMAFNSDGTILAVSSVGASASGISLWDVARRERLGQPFAWQGGRAFSLAFSPDGKTLLTTIEDKGLVSWDVDPVSWRRRACEIANRNLTHDEWTRFMGAEPYRATCPTLPIDPDLVDAGRRRARAGDIEGAVAIFERARRLEPSLNLDPRKEAVKSSVEELVESGKYLAVSGDVEAAILSFERARRLDPGLPLDPATEARRLAAPGVIAEALQLTERGKIADAVATFARAQSLDPALKVPGTAWNTLCWNGSLRGHAAAVMDACERAVKLDPENGLFHTSRGVAKAIVQRRDESIADFEAFLAWEEREQQHRMGFVRRQWLERQRLAHQRWIAGLRAGQNPFTADELSVLRDDKAWEQ